MGLLIVAADAHGIPLWLKVANESDDAFEYDEDDPDAPPSEDDLIAWYGRFGFEVTGYGTHTVMRRAPQPVLACEADDEAPSP